MKDLTQTDMILIHLKDSGGITSWEAIKEYGCTRLSARIYELRKRGYNIENERVYTRNRYRKPVSYVRYVLKENEEQKSFWRNLWDWI